MNELHGQPLFDGKHAVNGTGEVATNGEASAANNNLLPHLNGSTSAGAFRDVPGYTPSRRLKVVTVGAGFSGLLFAHKLQHQYTEMQDMVEHKIIESRSELGGTWLVNTYPGIQCDVPAHIYVRGS